MLLPRRVWSQGLKETLYVQWIPINQVCLGLCTWTSVSGECQPHQRAGDRDDAGFKVCEWFKLSCKTRGASVSRPSTQSMSCAGAVGSVSRAWWVFTIMRWCSKHIAVGAFLEPLRTISSKHLLSPHLLTKTWVFPQTVAWEGPKWILHSALGST